MVPSGPDCLVQFSSIYSMAGSKPMQTHIKSYNVKTGYSVGKGENGTWVCISK